MEEELATIANRFKLNDKTQDNGMDKTKDGEASVATSKHDRRGNQDEEEDDDHFNDSVYNSDENTDANRSMGPDVTIVKQEGKPRMMSSFSGLRWVCFSCDPVSNSAGLNLSGAVS